MLWVPGMYTEMNLNHVKKRIMASLNIRVAKQVIVIVIFFGQFCPRGKGATRQETGPTVYSRYPRRLECLTICRYHYKGSTFFSVPECWSGLGLEPMTSRTADWRSTNWANQAGANKDVQYCFYDHITHKLELVCLHNLEYNLRAANFIEVLIIYHWRLQKKKIAMVLFFQNHSHWNNYLN